MDKLLAKALIEKWISKKRYKKLLDLSNLECKKLPELPPTLRKLRLHSTQLETLEGLPGNLSHLYISDNYNIKSLEGLPQNLKQLYISNLQQLENISDLPDSIRILKLDDLNVHTINAFPVELRLLEISYIFTLKYINKFPPKLVEITLNELGSCNVLKLPDFPESLKYLSCNFAPICKLPPLPPNIKYIDIFQTSITTILDIPKSLISLSLYNMEDTYAVRDIIFGPHLLYLHCNNKSLCFNKLPISYDKYACYRL
jgi:hypothetical protein